MMSDYCYYWYACQNHLCCCHRWHARSHCQRMTSSSRCDWRGSDRELWCNDHGHLHDKQVDTNHNSHSSPMDDRGNHTSHSAKAMTSHSTKDHTKSYTRDRTMKHTKDHTRYYTSHNGHSTTVMPNDHRDNPPSRPDWVYSHRSATAVEYTGSLQSLPHCLPNQYA